MSHHDCSFRRNAGDDLHDLEVTAETIGGGHVLFVAGCWYPTTDNPVAGLFIRRHAEAVARSQRVTVLHPFPAAAGEPPTRQWSGTGRLRELRCSFRAESGSALSISRGYWRAGREAAAAVCSQIGRPQLLHFHVIPSLALTAAMMRAFPGLPVVITEHWSGYTFKGGAPLSLARRLYTRWFTRRAKAVTTVSDHLRRAMLEHGFAGRYRVVPNVVDTDLFRPRQERRPGPFRFVTVCVLRPGKRVPAMVRAIGRLRASGCVAELHVVGDGPDRPAAEAAAREIAPVAGADAVVFHGQLAGEGVAMHLRHADALLMFSDFENSPCVIGEAFASGCPVIATRVAGIPEHVNEERGMLVKVGDEAGLDAALAALAGGHRRFDSAELRRYAVATYSPQVISAQFSAIYEACWGSRRWSSCQ